jgi:hypothetical protein
VFKAETRLNHTYVFHYFFFVFMPYCAQQHSGSILFAYMIIYNSRIFIIYFKLMAGYCFCFMPRRGLHVGPTATPPSGSERYLKHIFFFYIHRLYKNILHKIFFFQIKHFFLLIYLFVCFLACSCVCCVLFFVFIIIIITIYIYFNQFSFRDN